MARQIKSTSARSIKKSVGTLKEPGPAQDETQRQQLDPATAPGSDIAASSDREQRVRDRAYRMWEEAGRPEGQHEEHWHSAGREVDEDKKDA